VQGVIVPDIPRLESAAFRESFSANGIEFIQFATPENRKEQITEVAEDAEGFLYFVSIRGTTGSSLTLDEDTKEKIALARNASAVPVVLGFGIRDAATANLALENADGFIIGTRIVELLNNGGITHVEDFYRELAEGLEQAGMKQS
jgi:tryptophan synthase alpha chain